MSATGPLLVYGGTFDPVHSGHVSVACTAADRVRADQVHVLPCGDPPHRPPAQAGGEQRAAMLRLAFAGDARCDIDTRELRRAGPSYTVDTLRELRAHYGEHRPIVLLLGRDAANGLASWHEAGALSALAHLLVVARTGSAADANLLQGLGWRPVADPLTLGSQPAGLSVSIDMPVSPWSSTAVRQDLPGARAALPPGVADYIRRNGLYRPS